MLLWNANVMLSILSYSTGQIDALINLQPHLFYFTSFYSNPVHNLRFLSWCLLDNIASTHSDRSLSWVVGGDFNEILFDNDKQGGAPTRYFLINNFINALINNNLSSLKASGPSFTWDNHCRHPYNVLERLDRFIVNDSWRNNFPNSISSNLDYFNSDHRAICLDTDNYGPYSNLPLYRKK